VTELGHADIGSPAAEGDPPSSIRSMSLMLHRQANRPFDMSSEEAAFGPRCQYRGHRHLTT